MSVTLPKRVERFRRSPFEHVGFLHRPWMDGDICGAENPFTGRLRSGIHSGRMVVEDVRHIKLCRDKGTYCGHSSQGGIINFGGSHFIA